ncbi:hypothetical protein BCS71_25330 (plasmid) [Vibrio lentus]|uniref:hypothetical protein n=1 Tax=Vibrio lentus TaxID=136468 RepID=UPI000C816389|nr:hypothetical protein [Vibrio lentus]PMI60699.1 hypothetical protein BCU41_02135 [Vibrio lentus]
MLTVGMLIDHLCSERKKLDAECREPTLSYVGFDFELDPIVEHGTNEYVLEISDTNTKPLSVDGNIKYLQCFNRDLPIRSEGAGFNNGRNIRIVAHNLACGKVEFELEPEN